jgi:hypothetical protein
MVQLFPTERDFAARLFHRSNNRDRVDLLKAIVSKNEPDHDIRDRVLWALESEKKPNVGTKSGKYAAFFDTSMKPLGCAPYPQTRLREPPVEPMHPIYARVNVTIPKPTSYY